MARMPGRSFRAGRVCDCCNDLPVLGRVNEKAAWRREAGHTGLDDYAYFREHEMAEQAHVERLCAVMHATQDASGTPWADVPEEDKVPMRAAVRALLGDLCEQINDKATWAFESYDYGAGDAMEIVRTGDLRD